MPSKAKPIAITNHDEIRHWAEARGAQPTCVRNTGNRHDIGILRLDFPGFSDDDQSLEPLAWDEWFAKFDELGLALLHEQVSANGQRSNFNKLVSREMAVDYQSQFDAAPSRSRKTRASKPESGTSRKAIGISERTAVKEIAARGQAALPVKKIDSRSRTRPQSTHRKAA